MPIEGGSNSTEDRHVLVVDRDHCILYELFFAFPIQGGSWQAGSGAVFDLTSSALRRRGWVSADEAGLPILPGLVRYEEVAAGEIRHALRFTAPSIQRGFLWPARHFTSSITDTASPLIGQRFRLKGSFDISSFPTQAQMILTALKRYGMMLAGYGPSWQVSGAPDPSWDNAQLGALRRVPGSAFEAVDTLGLMIDPDSGQAKGTPTAINHAPVADAGLDRLVPEGARVMLDGSLSFDPDGDFITYAWTQLDGPPVSLDHASVATPRFMTPALVPGPTRLTFQLVVSDGFLDSTPATVTVGVNHHNHAPVAATGPDQSVPEGALVTLDGTASFDPDGDPLVYGWVQVEGPAVTLSDPATAMPTFTSPPVGPAGATLRFELVVNDGTVDSSADAVEVAITNVNQPPLANAGGDLTRNEGALVTLDGSLSKDPDGDALTYQ